MKKHPLCILVRKLYAMLFTFLLFACLYGCQEPIAAPTPNYATIEAIPIPKGYTRLADHAFAKWLLQVQLKKDRTVYLYNGEKKEDQASQYAVLNIPIGKEDLQQCADAVIRLRAEYLYNKQDVERIAFHATDGTLIAYTAWLKGQSFQLKHNKLVATKVAARPDTRETFEKYLRFVFMYAGTHSLAKELKPVNIQQIQPGDVFVQGSFPGHAMIVMSVAQNPRGEKIYMLAQGYTPAQSIHVVRNRIGGIEQPWYKAEEFGTVITPGWTFLQKHLMRFQ
ncbi:uncharacterized protein DUF4846 [Chitinophaga skermanii]|uniref:Uncharacterized protein DUF4846 n=1 Tax=Chitinophaga skermanii TaxID=331697 RepID=A0A327QW57_9BACT|nr:DUF4846 domain-containing protein [Chitinophaga skermanii]RAJ08175.1 uncharacterized protein DUF4846 [Chitinophaga skermanii]